MFEFKPLAEEDFAELFRRLQHPHVKSWRDSEVEGEPFRRRHLEMIQNALVFPHIVERAGDSIGFNNYWFVEEDPYLRNAAAIRAYEKAGFRKSRVMKSAEGEVQLMEISVTWRPS